MTARRRRGMLSFAWTVLCAIMFAIGGAAAAPPQPSFATPEDAVSALLQAVQTGDPAALVALLGHGSETLVRSGDPVADAAARRRFLDSYASAHSLIPRGDTLVELTVGNNPWPMPIPLVRSGGRWHFDTPTGAQQIIDRRIGRNELMTIHTLLSGVAAQKDYFDRVARGTGHGAYARRILSTPGKQDGLYWEVPEGAAPSPLGPLLDQAEAEGYPGSASPTGQPVPYQGYHFRILTGQGPHAPGGAKAYVQRGQMSDGFAFVAWPAAYGSSGLMTFLVDQDGTVFQKDLGPDTAAIVARMTLFDPDASWARVDVAH